MPINTNELLNIIAQVSEERGIKVAVCGSLKGAALTSATTFIGGLLLGPVGLAVGNYFSIAYAFILFSERES